jgi:hypothetical protein
LLVLVACARVRPLGGGEPDTVAPRLERATPADSTTGLPRNTVFTFQFDETLDRASARAAVRTYPHQARREIEVKGGRITLSFPDSLPADTTFIIVLGEGLQDQKPRDNRLAEELWFQYATRPDLNDAAVFGRILTQGVAEPDGAVQYEPIPADTSQGRQRPRYPLAAANAEGLFRLYGIPPGRRFMLRAFADRNHNRLLDPDELQAALPETLSLDAGQVRRGLQWNLVDPNEKGSVSGVAINRSNVEGRVAIALRLVPRSAPDDSTQRDAPASSRRGTDTTLPRAPQRPPGTEIAPPEQMSMDSVVVGVDSLPAEDRQQSGYEWAYAALDSIGFQASEWRIAYATPRGDYSIRVAPGRHWIVAFVDANRDSMPGLYVTPDSLSRRWEPLWSGDTLYVAPGEEQRAPSIDLEPRRPSGS